MTPSACIAISTYNSGNYIKDTINSCLAQTYSKTKVIVIDDCSTDSTVSLLKDYGDKIHLIELEKNQGITKNINLAVENAESDFIIFLGHDDILPPAHVELMISEFIEDDIVAVHCNSLIIDSEGKEMSFSRNDELQKKKSANALFELAKSNFIQSCGMMHRVSAFKQAKCWDERFKFYGEWLYYIKVLGIGRIKYTSLTYSYYRRHETNISKSLRSKSLMKSFTSYCNECRRLAFASGEFTVFQKLNYIAHIFYINFIDAIPMSFKRYVKRMLSCMKL